MRRALLAAVLACAALGAGLAPRAAPAQPLASASPVARDSAAAAGIRVSLLTFGQGSLFWEVFGHNAIRIRDASRGLDVAYNWGVFDFRQPGFLRRFLLNDPLYSAEAWPGQGMIDAYVQADRTVWEQELALTPAQRIALREFAEWNAREENKHYRYDYFRDNCSTRVRDAIDRALGGALTRALGDTTRLSYRGESLRLMGGRLAAYAGMDVALGNPADRRLTQWEASFIPMRLRDYLRGVRVADGAGGTRSLVQSERVLYQARRAPERESPPHRVPGFLFAGAAIAALIVWLARGAERGSRGARRAVATLASISGTLGGLFGVVLTVAWAATSHAYWYRNENLLQFSPIALFLAVLAPLALRAGASERTRRAARRVSLALAVLSVTGFVVQPLPGFDQSNGNPIAAALPVHLAVAWAMWRLTRASQESDARRESGAAR